MAIAVCSNVPNCHWGGDYIDSGVGENEMFMDYVKDKGTLTALPYPTVTYYAAPKP